MTRATELRQAMAEFLGDERFRKFVGAGYLRGRLRFWQEREWRRFVAARPEFATALPDLAAAIRVCEMHETELLPDTVAVFHGCTDLAQRYVDAGRRLFPHAASMPVATEARDPSPSDRVGVWYCPACREAERKWARSPDAPRPERPMSPADRDELRREAERMGRTELERSVMTALVFYQGGQDEGVVCPRCGGPIEVEGRLAGREEPSVWIVACPCGACDTVARGL